jgi:signal transduction histidine kinase
MKKRAVSFNGELRIDSDAGRGTTVWLRAPLAQKNWLTLRQ